MRSVTAHQGSLGVDLKRQAPVQTAEFMPSETTLPRPVDLWIMLTATLAVTPMMLFGIPLGHDLDFQMPGWMEAADQLRHGIIFHRWSAVTNHGFGEPFFIFYPPLSRMMGAILGLVLPWRMVPGVYVWMVLTLAGAVMWRCAQEWLQPPGALMAALLYATNPYILLTVYKRCAYAELLAIALFPALVWGGIRMGKDARHVVLPLSLIFATLWISDLPSAVVASYTLAGLLVLGSLVYRTFRPLLYGAVAILAGLGAIAFFLLPAAWERRWVNIGEAIKFQWMPEHNFLFSHGNLPQYVTFNRGLSFFALLVIAVTAGAAALASQLRRDKPQDWRLLAGLAAASTFMMLPPSLVLYWTLPELRFIQFPWRWFSPLCVAGAVLTASAMAEARRKWIPRAIAALAVACIAAVILRTSWWDPDHHLDELNAVVHSDVGFRSIANWDLPLGSQPSQLDKPVPLVTFWNPTDDTGPSANIAVSQWAAERKVFSVDASRPLLLKLRLVNYPAWQANISGKSVPVQTEAGSGQMLVAVPAAFSRVEIDFGRTLDRTLGIVMSLVTVFGIFPLLFWLTREQLGEIDPAPRQQQLDLHPVTPKSRRRQG